MNLILCLLHACHATHSNVQLWTAAYLYICSLKHSCYICSIATICCELSITMTDLDQPTFFTVKYGGMTTVLVIPLLAVAVSIPCLSFCVCVVDLIRYRRLALLITGLLYMQGMISNYSIQIAAWYSWWRALNNDATARTTVSRTVEHNNNKLLYIIITVLICCHNCIDIVLVSLKVIYN